MSHRLCCRFLRLAVVQKRTPPEAIEGVSVAETSVKATNQALGSLCNDLTRLVQLTVKTVISEHN